MAHRAAHLSLHLRQVRLSLPGRVLIDRLDAEVAPGEVLVIMGPSGCGKSSLLHWMIGALAAPFVASGELRLGGQDVSVWPTERRRIGLMFQDDLLFPHMTVRDNLLFALPAAVSRQTAARRAEVEAALTEAGLAGLSGCWPQALSGGQRSRVSLVRAMLARPGALLLDEPFARLDHGLRAQMREVVWATLRARQVPAVLVTHDPADVPPGARVVHMASATTPPPATEVRHA